MRSVETNLSYDKDMTQKIISLIRNEQITISIGMENKMNHMKNAINSVPDIKLNSSLKWIKSKLNDLSNKVHIVPHSNDNFKNSSSNSFSSNLSFETVKSFQTRLSGNNFSNTRVSSPLILDQNIKKSSFYPQQASNQKQ